MSELDLSEIILYMVRWQMNGYLAESHDLYESAADAVEGLLADMDRALDHHYDLAGPECGQDGPCGQCGEAERFLAELRATSDEWIEEVVNGQTFLIDDCLHGSAYWAIEPLPLYNLDPMELADSGIADADELVELLRERF